MTAFRKYVFFALVYSHLNLAIHGQEDENDLPKPVPDLSELLLHGAPFGASNDSLNGRFEEKVELPESGEQNKISRPFEDSVNNNLEDVVKNEESEVPEEDSIGLDLPKREGEDETKYLEASEEDQAVDTFGGEVQSNDIEEEGINSSEKEHLENEENQDSQENKEDEADDNFYRAKSYDVDQGANEYSKEDLGETRKTTSYSDEKERYSSEDEQFDLNDSEAVEGGTENNTEVEGEKEEEEEEKDAWYNADMDDEDEDEHLESDEEDDDDDQEWDEQYKKWNEKQIGNTEEEEEDNDDEDDFNNSNNSDELADNEKLMIEEVVGEELAKKNKPPTGPSSMVIFYTWMVVALLVLVVGVSTYQSRCKGVKEGGGTDDSMNLTFNRGKQQNQDSKRLLDHEYA